MATVVKTIAPSTWIGNWIVQYDSIPRPEQLIITDSKMDCASSPWCHLVVVAVDATGNRKIKCQIEKMDDNFRHIVLSMNRFKFDARIFDNQTEMAGVLIHPKGRKFDRYFHATKG